MCPSCRAKLDRDVNAAINIKNFGISNSSLGGCTPEVKSVEHRKQKRKNAKSSDVSDVEKQKQESSNIEQMPVIQNNTYLRMNMHSE